MLRSTRWGASWGHWAAVPGQQHIFCSLPAARTPLLTLAWPCSVKTVPSQQKRSPWLFAPCLKPQAVVHSTVFVHSTTLLVQLSLPISALRWPNTFRALSLSPAVPLPGGCHTALLGLGLFITLLPMNCAICRCMPLTVQPQGGCWRTCMRCPRPLPTRLPSLSWAWP